MATDDDQQETSEAARKRAAPTIDLDPSEVTDTTPGSEEKPAADKAQTGWRSRFGGGRASSDGAGPGDAVSPAAVAPSRIILAAAFSAAVVALLVSGLWSVLSPNSSDPDIPPAQTATIESLTTRVASLENKPAAPVDLTTLTKRLDALDQSVAAIRSDVAAVRDQMRDASAKIAALEKAATPDASAEKIAAMPDLSGIEGRVSKLEQQAVSVEAAKPVAAPPQDDAALRRALAASALDQAAQQGLPYAAALATASRLGADAAGVLKPLDLFAATGVPGADALSREFVAQLPGLQSAPVDKPAAGGWVEHLRNSAARLVRVTRTDGAGSDRAALLSRAKAAAEHGDLQETQKIVAQLPEQDRKALQGWTGKVQARAAALAASRAFNQAAAAALSAPSR